MSVMMAGTSKKKKRKDYAFRRQFSEYRAAQEGAQVNTRQHALQKLLSLGKAWRAGEERHACDLGHLEACMPAEGITPLAEGMAHHPVHPGTVRLLHKGTTTAWLDVMLAICMQASAVCTWELPVCVS